MSGPPNLGELIGRAKNGDREAMTQVVHRFVPVVKKYSRRVGYDDAYSDLVAWMVEAVYRYRPGSGWGGDGSNRYLPQGRGRGRRKTFTAGGY